jgi:hypothetical protein
MFLHLLKVPFPVLCLNLHMPAVAEHSTELSHQIEFQDV